MNTDQGCQYTSAAWSGVLREAAVQISMDGKRRWIDIVMAERPWRSLKYEDSAYDGAIGEEGPT